MVGIESTTSACAGIQGSFVNQFVNGVNELTKLEIVQINPYSRSYENRNVES